MAWPKLTARTSGPAFLNSVQVALSSAYARSLHAWICNQASKPARSSSETSSAASRANQSAATRSDQPGSGSQWISPKMPPRHAIPDIEVAVRLTHGAGDMLFNGLDGNTQPLRHLLVGAVVEDAQREGRPALRG